MLQSVLTGKASETFSALPLETSGDYEFVKKAILKAYELVPEAYRQKFRTAKKQYDQTHVEFAYDKEQLFDKWLTSKDVDKDFHKLRQLILIEEFKRCIHSSIKTHLDERKIDNLGEAATMADDYAITHKLSFSKFNSNTNNRPSQANQQQYDEKPKPESSENGVTHMPQEQQPETFKQTHKLQEQKPDIFKPGPTCSYCKKKGHLISQCWLLQKKEDQNNTFPSALIVAHNLVHNFEARKPKIFENKLEIEEIMEEFKPFVTERFVSLIGDENNLQPIKILRDTAASKTLILQNVLPFSQQSSVDANVLVESIDLQKMNVPLHNIYLKSDFVTGPVTVGIRPTFPIKGISMLLGNDLAGTKVVPDHVVSKQPCLTEEVEEDNKMYPSCVETRTMSKKLVGEDRETQKSETNTGELLGLEDTFLAILGEENMDSKDVPSADDDEKCHDKDPLTRDMIIVEQQRDPVLVELYNQSLSQQEAKDVPYELEKRVNDIDYIVKTNTSKSVSILSTTMCNDDKNIKENVNTNENVSINVNENVNKKVYNITLKDSDVLNALDNRLNHLSCEQSNESNELLHKYENLFIDTVHKTNLEDHNVDVNHETLVEQRPPEVIPSKSKIMKKGDG